VRKTAGNVTDKANRCSESTAGREVVTSPSRQVQKRRARNQSTASCVLRSRWNLWLGQSGKAHRVQFDIEM